MLANTSPAWSPSSNEELLGLVRAYQQDHDAGTLAELSKRLRPMLYGLYRQVGRLLCTEEDPGLAWERLRAAFLEAVTRYKGSATQRSVAYALKFDIFDALRPLLRRQERRKREQYPELVLVGLFEEERPSRAPRELPPSLRTEAYDPEAFPFELLSKAVQKKLITQLDRTLLLSWAHDCDMAEVAKDLEISLTYARKRLCLAKKALRRAFA